MQILILLAAILGLSFLVFIHELGHYLVARRVGMKVEAFSIGFGKPLLSWKRDGVLWQIGMLPFGGYVKIAGMEKEKGKEPHEIEDGFFGKSPWDRIQVALAGPLVNIVFTFLAFSALFLLGGREKQFSSYTNIVGLVDPQSTLYEKGLRPGDEITEYNGQPFTRFQEMMLASVSNETHMSVKGNHINYVTKEKTPFSYTLPVYPHPGFPGSELKTIGILSPANFLYVASKVPAGAPLDGAHLKKGDRIVWANGELLFSTAQLLEIINAETAYLTIKRDGKITHVTVPTKNIDAVHFSKSYALDLDDWKHETLTKKGNTFIPYEVESTGVVQKEVSFDAQAASDAPFSKGAAMKDTALKVGDLIVGVNGLPVQGGVDLFEKLQNKRVVLLSHSGAMVKDVPEKVEDAAFENAINYKEVLTLAQNVGIEGAAQATGTYRILQPAVPVSKKEASALFGQEEAYSEMIAKAEEKVAGETNSEKRGALLDELQSYANSKALAVHFFDQTVTVNPGPFAMMGSVLKEMYVTFSSLLTGKVSPKWMSGPVGIVSVMHSSWSQGFEEALYWLGVISLNLGVLNLLPLPVLDGGHIVMSLFEMVTRRRISSKMMQRIVIPFVVLLVGFIVYVTYQDVSRLLFGI